MQVELSYSSIEVKRYREVGLGKLEVTVRNNSTITSVSFEGDHLVVGFVFTTTYEPRLGEIRIEGNLKLKDEEKKLAEVKDSWEKERTLPRDVAEEVHSLIIMNCIVETVVLAREVKLPFPLPTPKLRKEKLDYIW